ncbi:hypothetical protein BJ138DRAFT_1168162 [Hygrophoropsis aurantiaca]|uniref:Uncharacterized protein n=1 Tax=Hygrophoropsis aurantiaca TaxID=72124 RepID=A0ACB7ZRN9_9AGAM|nr:hypothetical protein BJ138DRAFT_1168162 [Hygrophoropsis aurantiaca]
MDASPRQYCIWLAWREYNDTRRRAVSQIDSIISIYEATQCDTHEGYLVNPHP